MTDFEKAFRELDLAVEQGLQEAANLPVFYRTTPAEGRIIGLQPRQRAFVESTPPRRAVLPGRGGLTTGGRP